MKYKSDVGPINLGSDHEYSLVDIANKIIEISSSASKVKFEKELLFMRPLVLPNISKARSILGWLPLIRLEHGLKKSINYALAKKGRIGI